VTQYPAAADITNLRAMDLLRDQTGLDIGLSDHSLGWHIALAAVARGACVIEKHFTLSRSLPGPDHAASLEPEELARMVREIREVEAALGRYEKTPQEIEIQNRYAARGSLVAARPISQGELFSPDNLTIKRPGGGVSPRTFWDYVGTRRANRNYAADELIDAEDNGLIKGIR
jgi:N-acetylneuraminate synthase